MPLKKGRPAESKHEDQPVKFSRVFKYDDGIVITEHWNLNKSTKGPMAVDITYPKDYKDFDETQDNLPKTKRMYVNPKNGKLVKFFRAKQLGLVK